MEPPNNGFRFFRCAQYLALLLVVCVPFPGFAQPEDSPEKKGQWVAHKHEENFDHYNDTTADMIMHLKKNDSPVITRKLTIKIKQTEEDTDLVLMQFHHPADVKGMAFLMKTHKNEFDDLWVYIPDLRRVKRGSSQTKGSEFMGSDLQTEDLIRAEPEKYTYKWLEDKPCGDQECYLVDRYPKEKSSIYSRQIIWIDKNHFRIHKMESYDKKGDHIKTLEFYGYRLYDDKFWRWSAHKLKDHRNGEETHTEFKNWKFNNGLKKSEFTVNGLKNIR